MQTRLCPIGEESLKDAARIIASGGLVAFPTETVYGLGGNGLDAKAVLSIFAAKERPADNPLILHIRDVSQALPLCEWTEQAGILARAFWPGPMTMLLKKKPAVPDEVTAGLPSVALRIPGHPSALAFLEAVGLPVAAPSANRSGRPSPTLARHVFEDMQGRVPLILDGGACAFGVESTVVDMTGSAPLILRPGAVTCEQIAMVLGECGVADSVMRPLRDGEAAPSPGMRHRHYAPRAEMTLYEGEPEKVAAAIRAACEKESGACVFALTDHLDRYKGLNVRDMGKDAAEAAHRLFYLLRDMDDENIRYIHSETLPPTGLGLAVMNRMARAAAFRTVAVS